MGANSLSNQISAILKRNGFTYSGTPDFETARAQLAAACGAKTAEIDRVVQTCANYLAGGADSLLGIPRDLKAHSAYCDAFNDLCGFPDEYKVAMQKRLRDGDTVRTIAADYGWTAERVARFLNGDRSQYFNV